MFLNYNFIYNIYLESRWICLWLLFFLICVSLAGFSQKETNNWYFGKNAGLDFNSGSPVPISGSAMNTHEGCSSISDSVGNLLFYTNGVTVWNKNNQVMLNGTGLLGNNSTTQSALIVKKPGSTFIYYIFTVVIQAGFVLNSNPYPFGGLAYSTVDMTKDFGKGEIILKNIPLITPTTEQVTAVKHCNNQDIWVITRKYTTNEFFSYLLTNSGIDTNAIVSKIGIIPFQTAQSISTLGALKVSPNGKKIARVIYGMGIELFDFNSLSGVISNRIPLWIDTINYPTYYGCEFSPDASVLYFTYGLTLFQYDLKSNDSLTIVNSKTNIHTFTGSSQVVRKETLQLGSNNKIYVAHDSKPFLGVINNPNNVGVNCNYIDTGLVLTSGTCDWGLPNFITSFFRTTPNFCISYDYSCFGDSTFFLITDTLGVDSVLWDFGDIGSLSNSSSLLYPSHKFSDIGNFAVQLTAFFNGISNTIVDTVYIFPSPNKYSLGADTALCNGTSLTLQSGIADSYLWQNNSTDSVLFVESPGIYWVKSSIGYCYQSDTINISYISKPTVSFINDTTLCNGDSLKLSATNENGIYIWQDNSHDSIFTIKQQGIYWVNLTNQCGSNSDTIYITYITSPSVSLGNDTILCGGDSLVLNAKTNNATYQWQDDSTDSMIIINQLGTYWVSLSNQCGLASDTITINYISFPSILFGEDKILCNGDSLKLSASNENASYYWQDNSQDSIFTIKQQGVFWVTVSNQCGSVGDTITVNYLNPPQTNLGNDTVFCINDTIKLNATNPQSTYLWQNNTSGATFQATNTGIYSVDVTNLCGVATDSILLTQYSIPNIDLGNDTASCLGQSLKLDIDNGLWIKNNFNINWQDGIKDTIYFVTQPGMYWIHASNICGVYGDTINVSYDTPSQFSLGQDTTVCYNDTVTLVKPNVFNIWQWQDGSSLITFEVTQQGTYWLQGTKGACTVTDSINVIYLPKLPSLLLGNDTILCNQDSIFLHVGLWYSFNWSTGQTTQAIYITGENEIKTISVTIQDINGCTTSDTVVVQFTNCVGIFPNNTSKTNVKIYPNPANEYFYVSGELKFPAIIEIVDLYGNSVLKQVIQNNEEKIIINNLSSSLYFFKLTQYDGEVVNGKVLLNK